MLYDGQRQVLKRQILRVFYKILARNLFTKYKLIPTSRKYHQTSVKVVTNETIRSQCVMTKQKYHYSLAILYNVIIQVSSGGSYWTKWTSDDKVESAQLQINTSLQSTLLHTKNYYLVLLGGFFYTHLVFCLYYTDSYQAPVLSIDQ